MIPKIINAEIKIVKKITKFTTWLLISILYTFLCDLRREKGQAWILRSLLLLIPLWCIYAAKTTYSYKNPIVKEWTYQEIKIHNLEQENIKLKEELGFYNKLTKGEKEIIVEYIKMKFKEKARVALAVATCESNITANRIGDNHLTFNVDGKEYGRSYGIFQIRHLQGRPDPEWLLNAKNNIDYAYNLEEEQGFEPWTCFSGGYYTKYL